jgi:hypothetical protein
MTRYESFTGSYSYQGQDLFVLEVLQELTCGFFLDSGASNGTRGSNSRLLEEHYGWRGICVEPNDGMFKELSASRVCTCYNHCLHVAEGEIEFVEAAGVFGGIANAYEPGQLKALRAALPVLGAEGTPLPTVKKKARTIRSVLRDAAAPSIIDYWSLDTEGSELDLLKSFPFDEYRVRVLTVEHNNTPARKTIRTFLEGAGFVRVRDLGIDDGYVWHEDETRTSRSAWRSGRRRYGRQ